MSNHAEATNTRLASAGPPTDFGLDAEVAQDFKHD